MAYNSEVFKERWRTDAEFREKRLAMHRRWSAKRTPEQTKKKVLSRKKWAEKESSKPKLAKYQRDYRHRYPLVVAIRRTMKRAMKYDVPVDQVFLKTLERSNLGSCECCGIAFRFDAPRKIGHTPDRSLSIDKINPLYGYIEGNVGIICWRCNSLKKNGSILELEKIIAYMRKGKYA